MILQIGDIVSYLDEECTITYLNENYVFFSNGDIADIEDHYRSEIAHFFQVYKDLEGKKVEIIGWKSAEDAKRVVNESIKRYNDDLKKD